MINNQLGKVKGPQINRITKVIDWSVDNQVIVFLLMALLTIFGLWAIKNISLDAIPDLSDTQVIIRTDFTGQSPQIVEDLVTYPLSTTMLGLPKTQDVRGYSMFGSSFVYIVFEDGVDEYWARSRVVEALSKVEGDLPQNANPQIGPDATGVGWVYQYAVVDKEGNYDLAYLRSLQDWFLKFELASVEGVSEVASVGGFVKEYQVLVDPNRLRAYDVPLSRIIQAVRAASKEVGGRVIEQGEMELIIRSKGYIANISDLQKVVVYADNGTPVILSDVARIVEGPELRRGLVELDGEGEVVGGIIIMRSRANALAVIEAVKEKIDELEFGLPEGIELKTVYDRAPLIQGAVRYLTRKLVEEALTVGLICFLFLAHLRSASVAIITLPLGIFGAFIVMYFQGVTVNIMSLSGIAIAIGAMVDASIVMVENAHRKVAELPISVTNLEKREAIILAAKEVAPGIFFSLLIITVSFFPVFALQGESFRLFSSLAYTKTYAMAFASFVSVTVIPVLMLWFLRGKIVTGNSNFINRGCIALYNPILNLALKHKIMTLIVTLVLFISTIFPLAKIGSEFMPDLYEGELLYMPTTLPGISIAKAKEVLSQTNRLIKTIPEVVQVFGKVGRADTATDPAPISMIESWIRLKPKEEWREGLSVKGLISELDATVKMPGLVNSWGYPTKIRTDMNSTGIRTPLGIKISGNDLDEIDRIALRIEALVKNIVGTRSAIADRVVAGKYLDILPDRDELARQNIDLGVFQQVIQTTLGGMKISESIQGRERYNIILRYGRPFREHAEDLSDILVPTPSGAHIPLGELASIEFVEGPTMIKSENARLTGWVFVDIIGRDIGSYVEEARNVVARAISLPSGYVVEWSGQFEQMEEANSRMLVAIPLAILVVLILLILYFGRLDRTFIVLLALPFGLVGGVWAMYFAEYNFSVAVGVGFIALGGVAVETTIIMLLYIDQQIKTHAPRDLTGLLTAVKSGAVMRVRPKLMTVITIIAGLIPIFVSEGLGSDVMRRIALPMLGGMVSTAILTLIVIPVVYFIWESRHFPKTITTR